MTNELQIKTVVLSQVLDRSITTMNRNIATDYLALSYVNRSTCSIYKT
jgi:hypothetical protein